MRGKPPVGRQLKSNSAAAWSGRRTVKLPKSADYQDLRTPTVPEPPVSLLVPWISPSI